MRFWCEHCQNVVGNDQTQPGNTIKCPHCGVMVSAPDSRVAPGAVIGDFLIEREHGKGGMGLVYRARQISLDRPAALKILLDKYAKDDNFVKQFIREARAAAKMNNPNIVQAFAVGEDQGIYYFAMEFIEGRSAKQLLKEKRKIDPKEAATMIRDIASALDFAWKERRIVHHDIKPDNIMLTSNGRAKLADLGLAKVVDVVGNHADDGEGVQGTPQYISPEQLRGEVTDGRSDLYSLGATLYHLVTGQYPFSGKNAQETAEMHLTAQLVPPNQIDPLIPRKLSDLICKMMEKKPEDRYQTGAEVVEALTDFLDEASGNGNPAMLQLRSKRPGVSPTASVRRPMRPGFSGPINVGSTTTGIITSTSGVLAPKTGAVGTVAVGTVADAAEKLAEERKKKIIIIGSIAAGVLLIVGVAFGVAGSSFGDKLVDTALGKGGSGMLDPVTGKPMTPAEIKAYFAKQKEQEKAAAQNKDKPAKTPVKPEQNATVAPAAEKKQPEDKPAKSYETYVQELMSFMRTRPSDREFLQKVDEFLAVYPKPGNEAEYKMSLNLLDAYNRVDERVRIQPMRDEARKRLEQDMDRRREQVAAQERQEEARKLQAEQQAKLKQAAEEQRKEAERIRQIEINRQKQLAGRSADFEREFNEERAVLPGIFMDTVESSDTTRLERAMLAARSRHQLPLDPTDRERTAQENFKVYSDQMYDEYLSIRSFAKFFTDPGKMKGVQFEPHAGELWKFVKIDRLKQEVQCVSMITNKPASFAMTDAKLLGLLLNALKRKHGEPDPTFAFLLINRSFAQIEPYVPKKGFWSVNFSAFVTDYFRNELAKQQNLQQLVATYGKYPEFRKAVAESKK